MASTITERSIGDVTVLDVPAQVMFYEAAAQLRTRINELVVEGRLKLLLDMRQVTYLDSFGVGVIASKNVSLRKKGGDLKLLHPSARSRHVLSIARLIQIIECFDEEDAAIRSFQSGATA